MTCGLKNKWGGCGLQDKMDCLNEEECPIMRIALALEAIAYKDNNNSFIG